MRARITDLVVRARGAAPTAAGRQLATCRPMRKDAVMEAITPGPVGMGYQGQDIDGFVDQVAAAAVGVVADVRLTPVSRKPGFSKNALAAILHEAGVEYVHLPALGNPKDNRAGFAGPAHESLAARARYGTILRSKEASAALDDIAALARDQRVAILCFEADEARCHRELVLSAVRHRLGA